LRSDANVARELRKFADAADAIHVSLRTLHRFRADERLEVVKIGGRLFVPQSEIDRILAEGTEPARKVSA
jgi:predicted site-specific integrase-resolvase